MTATAARSYKIASGDTLTNLEKAVNQYINGGWMPYGPPFMTGDNRIVQALILPVGANAAPGAAVPSNPGISAVAPQQVQQAAPRQQVPPQPQGQVAQQPARVPAQAVPAQPQPVAVRPRI